MIIAMKRSDSGKEKYAEIRQVVRTVMQEEDRSSNEMLFGLAEEPNVRT